MREEGARGQLGCGAYANAERHSARNKKAELSDALVMPRPNEGGNAKRNQ